ERRGDPADPRARPAVAVTYRGANRANPHLTLALVVRESTSADIRQFRQQHRPGSDRVGGQRGQSGRGVQAAEEVVAFAGQPGLPHRRAVRPLERAYSRGDTQRLRALRAVDEHDLATLQDSAVYRLPRLVTQSLEERVDQRADLEIAD